MDADRRRQAFASRFNAALEKGKKAVRSDGDIVKLLAREGVATTTQTVSNWRNGKHMPKLEQIEGLAAMLGVDPGELAFGNRHLGEPKIAYREGNAEERALAESFALLGEQERALVRELIRVLTGKATQPEKRPGPRKRR
jgi:transcriptional regulator with XRE-family HTH domain